LPRILSSSERKLFEKLLREQHGVDDPFKEYALFIYGDGKIRAVTPLAAEIAGKLRRVHQVGLYVAKLRADEVSLSIEGSQILGDKIKKNVIELNEEEARDWISAKPIKYTQRLNTRYVVARSGSLYLGSGRVSRDGRIYPQIAKWRRIPVRE